MGWNKAARNFVLAPDWNWTLIWHLLIPIKYQIKYQTKYQPADDSTKVGVLPMTFCRGVPSKILSSYQDQTKIVLRFVITYNFNVNFNNSFTPSSTQASFQLKLFTHPAMSSKPSTMSSSSTLTIRTCLYIWQDRRMLNQRLLRMMILGITPWVGTVMIMMMMNLLKRSDGGDSDDYDDDPL